MAIVIMILKIWLGYTLISWAAYGLTTSLLADMIDTKKGDGKGLEHKLCILIAIENVKEMIRLSKE